MRVQYKFSVARKTSVDIIVAIKQIILNKFDREKERETHNVCIYVVNNFRELSR